MNAPVPVDVRACMPPGEAERLERALAEHGTIKKAIDWLLSQEPPRRPTDSITQDEFSHDIIVAYGDGLYLVYDST
jgi:hypothetical protein